MRTILVDDEEWGLKRFRLECEHIQDVELLGSFTSPRKAIEFVAANRVELAFLDMEMPEMNGLELAGKLRELIPEIIIIFVSAYESYIAEAFRSKKADYYVMKPYSSEDIEDAVTRARLLSGRLRNVITARTFGKFELTVNGVPFVFENDKNKELLAFLIDRYGEPAAADEICGALWPREAATQTDAENRLRCRRQIHALKGEMQKVRISSAIEENGNRYFLHPDVLDSDYSHILQHDTNTIETYCGDYLQDYPWAEITRAALQQQKAELGVESNGSRPGAEDDLEAQYQKLTIACEALQKRCGILRDSEETYRTALSMTNHTVTMVDIPNKALCQIFNEGSWSGVQTTMTDAPESIIATGIIHKEDIENYREFYRRIYAGSPAEQCSIRTLSENGHWFWFTMYTQTVFDEIGTPKYAICFSDDITAQHEAEMMYRQFVGIIVANAEYAWEVNLSQDTIVRKDDRSATVLEAAHVSSYGEFHETVIMQINPDDRPLIREKYDRISMLQAYYDGVREVRAEYRYRQPNSTDEMWMESVTYLILDENEEVHAIMTTRDITESKLRKDRAESQSANDPLCNINRRDTFNQKVRQKLVDNQEGSLFMIDVDLFKHVNDNYGHLFGDRVLKDVANSIRRNFRAEDDVARYGGDEFAVYMGGTYSEKVLEAAATSLLNRIHRLEYENGYACSLSVGVAQHRPGEDLDALYKRADNALYEAKENGRNTFCIG